MRFEDITQDGMLKVGGMPHAIGMVCFRQLYAPSALNQATRQQGVVPILSNLVMEVADGPVGVGTDFTVDGRYQLGRTVNQDGEVDRLTLHMFADIHGARGMTHGPGASTSGAQLLAGRVRAEHVFTRPWGPREQRRVTQLEVDGAPFVPEDIAPLANAVDVLTPPEPVPWVHDEPRADGVTLCFGQSHTDSNQHVNSLVYPQLFEDAVLRALSDVGEDCGPLLVRHMMLGFRKPCFAGQRMTIALRLFKTADRWGAVAWLGEPGVEPARAHCMCRLRF